MLSNLTIKGVDFFAGGGGASAGLHAAGVQMLAALDHSPVAILTHQANFAHALHFCCDIRTQDEYELPTADIMWASPDCTHHSIAKGGQSRDAKERALAEELPRFALALNANCVMIENVKEFLQWGPVLEKNGKMVPDPARKGEYYRQWVHTMKSMGFRNYEYRLLNSADFGVPQSRTRYFGIFTRAGIPISWPTPTHDKTGRGGLPQWVAVRTVLDLDDRGRSIFTQWGKPIADKTLRRLLAGLKKHVIGGGAAQYMDKRTSNPPSGKPGTGASIGQPSPTIATCYLPDLVTPAFLANPAWGGGNLYLMSYYGNGGNTTLCRPCPTLSTHDRFAVWGWLSAGAGASKAYPFTRPARTIVASRFHQYLILAAPGSPVAHQPGDSEAMRLLKCVCRRHGIADIYMRMLKVSELKRIMGFPADYYLGGSATKQKEMLGNAVVPQVAEAIGRAMLPALRAAHHRVIPGLCEATVERWEQGVLFEKEATNG